MTETLEIAQDLTKATHECNCLTSLKKAEYERVISKLRAEVENLEEVNEHRWKQIKKLEEDIIKAGSLCKKLTEEKHDIQWEYDKLKSKEYSQSYSIENQRKRIEDLGKTLKLYEEENKAMRGLLKLWI